MSCFTGCISKSNQDKYMINRSTALPMSFSLNEIDELRKRFMKVSGNREFIRLQAFKKNMGILGLHCSQEFSERLFNAFDINNDNKIDFQDFLEYMEILKSNKDGEKARISFKMIVHPQQKIITKEIFKKFLSDFFVSWSFVTNIDITSEIKERTNQYIEFLFKKVEKQTGKPEIDLKYYVTTLYKDKDYMESFEFITHGMADIFISQNNNNPEAVLYKIIKQIGQIKETVFDMSNEESYYYEPVRVETYPTELPVFEVPIFKKPKNNKTESTKYRRDPPCQNYQKKTQATFNNQGSNRPSCEQTDVFSGTKSKSNNGYFDSPKLKKNESFDNSKLGALERKLKFIEQKIDKILQQTKSVFEGIRHKYENKQEFKNRKTKAADNVHKRIRRGQGNMVFIGDQNWNLVLNMMIGIQMAVRSVKGLQEIICEEPKDFGLKYYFQLIPRKFGNQDFNSTIYSFTDYAPNTFNHIRKIFKIDNEEYIESIGPNKLMASLMMGEVSSMTSLTSQGKSGSFFYYTADGKYMLKTISYREYKFLRVILEDYYFYLKKNPETLITKFFGLHKLISKSETGEETGRFYFVIMANVFNTRQKIVERYDIKGSWYGRDTVDNDPLATKKDNDFKKRQPLSIDNEKRKKLLQIIKKDSQFFQKHQIIDYSLLVGVIRKSDNSSQLSDARYQSRVVNRDTKEDEPFDFQGRESKIYLGGVQSCQSYIFGIIDILTLYDSRKVLQYYFKRLVYGEGISAVPPGEYSSRFYQFIEKSVFAGEGS